MEILSPGRGAADRYKIKYTPALRPPIRSQWMDLDLTKDDFGPINELLENLAKALDRGGNDRGDPRKTTKATRETTKQLESLGRRMHIQLLAPRIRRQLASPGLFLEFGVDELLLNYPLELIHDGDDFFCLKHFVGRFVNGSRQSSETDTPDGQDQLKERLSFLLVCVPRPQDRTVGCVEESLVSSDKELGFLGDAVTETKAIKETLRAGGITEKTGHLKVLMGEKATYDAVQAEVTRRRYHVVHFCGHAAFFNENPSRSRLMLYNENVTPGQLRSLLSANPPTLCFINGCESAKVSSGMQRFNVYGLAQAFLLTGSYLVGSRFRVNDRAAAVFAAQFYRSLVLEGKSLGEAVLIARFKCREAKPDRFDWASYVLYGDPRFNFPRFLKSKALTKKPRKVE